MHQDKVMAVSLRAFTLIELMIVVVILGVIAAFSIPNYSKSVEKSYERDAAVNLMAIYTAQKINYNNNNTYISAKDLTAINSALDLGLLANGVSYYCQASSINFACVASKGDGLSMKVTQDISSPCCINDKCPSIAKCGS